MQVPPISDPKKKWAVVFCALEGSAPDSSVTGELASMFRLSPAQRAFPRPTPPYRFSVADFWHDQSLGVVDVSDSPVYGWYPCGWTMIGALALRRIRESTATGRTRRMRVGPFSRGRRARY